MSESKKKKFAMIAASIAGIVAVSGGAAIGHAEESLPMGEGVACYGVNACKGQGVCGAKGHSCAGQNSCKGHGFINVKSKDACLAMKGGSLTALPITD